MIIPASNFTQKYNFECKTSDQTSENNPSSNNTFLKNNFLNPSNDHGYFCACIECRPIGNDHENFMADMPDDPAEIISDFCCIAITTLKLKYSIRAIKTACVIKKVVTIHPGTCSCPLR